MPQAEAAGTEFIVCGGAVVPSCSATKLRCNTQAGSLETSSNEPVAARARGAKTGSSEGDNKLVLRMKQMPRCRTNPPACGRNSTWCRSDDEADDGSVVMAKEPREKLEQMALPFEAVQRSAVVQQIGRRGRR